MKSGKVERGYLGVQLQPLDPGLLDAMKIPIGTEGALVAHVADNSPARTAGIQVGDIITRVNETTIRTAADLMNTVGLMLPGSKIKVTILRSSASQDVEVQLGTYPDQEAIAGSPNPQTQPAPRLDDVFGLGLLPMTEGLARQYGLASRTGLIIQSVQPGSAGDQAGLRAGDVILAVNNQAISKTKEFLDLTKNQDRVLLRVEREGSFFFVPLERSKGQS